MTNQQKIDQEKIEPVDVERCQAESKEPHQPFRLGFPEPRWERCKKRPKWVALEKRDPSKRGRGAMSLCAGCLAEFKKQFDDDTPVEPIAAFAAAHRLGGDAAVWELVLAHA